MDLFNENIEKSIGFVERNKFSSDQHNDRFKDLISNKTVENIEFEVNKKGDMFEVYLVGGIMVDHRGIRFNFFESVAPKVVFKSNLNNKKYVRLSVFYDKKIPRNYKIELRAFMLDDLKSTVGTHLGGDERLFSVGTFKVSGGKLELVERPLYHGEEVQIQIKDIYKKIAKEVEELNKNIESNNSNIDGMIDEKLNVVKDRIDKEVTNRDEKFKNEREYTNNKVAEESSKNKKYVDEKLKSEREYTNNKVAEESSKNKKYVDDKFSSLENKVDKNKEECDSKINDVKESASDSVDCLQNSIDTMADSINAQLVDLGITVTTGPTCSMDGEGDWDDKPTTPTPPPVLKRTRVGMKKENKGKESTFEKVETFDQNGKLLTRSILSDFRDGKYRKRTVTMNIGTPTETTYTLELFYDEDGDLIEERKV